MSKSKYSNVSKKDIINVINQTIRRMEILEVTLNVLVKYIERKNDETEQGFNDFLKEKLGDNNELQPDDTTDGKGNNSNTNEDS